MSATRNVKNGSQQWIGSVLPVADAISFLKGRQIIDIASLSVRYRTDLANIGNGA
jgi:hypothetical protein